MGVWWSGAWRDTDHASVDVAAELEDLGYTALWSSGGFQPGLSPHFERLLAATTGLTVISGIVSIWSTTPDEIALAVADLDQRHPGRFVLGLGASHAPIVEHYTRPYSHMVEYLDTLDVAAGPSAARQRRVLAALGPRMLRLAAERATGAHPYFVPVGHTVRAREELGADALLAPEVTVLLEKNHRAARKAARGIHHGLSLPPRTTPTTSAHSVSETTTSPEEEVTDWSMRLWPGVDRTGSPITYVSTSMPARTMSASRSSHLTIRFHSRSTESWPQR